MSFSIILVFFGSIILGHFGFIIDFLLVGFTIDYLLVGLVLDF